MTGSSTTILDQIARFIILLSDAPSYWFSLNKSCDYAFHISKRIGIDECDYQALLIAGHLAMLKGAREEFFILVDRWTSFINGHHFIDFPPDRKIEISIMKMTVEGKRQRFHVIRIGRVSDHSSPNINNQFIHDRPPPRINSLGIHQQSFR